MNESKLSALARDLVLYDGTQILSTPSSINRFNLLLTVEENSIKVTAVDRWGRHLIRDDEQSLITGNLWLPNQTFFLPKEISHFEELLNSKSSSSEKLWQEFFESNPHWLYIIGDYENHSPQLEMRMNLCSTDEFSNMHNLIPDFFIKRTDLKLWDIVEIKPPTQRVVVGKESRRRWSSQICEAIAQVKQYTSWFNDKTNINWFQNKHGIYIQNPCPIVVIGRDFEFQSEHEKQRLQLETNVKIVTYDDLRRIAKHRTLLS